MTGEKCGARPSRLIASLRGNDFVGKFSRRGDFSSFSAQACETLLRELVIRRLERNDFANGATLMVVSREKTDAGKTKKIIAPLTNTISTKVSRRSSIYDLCNLNGMEIRPPGSHSSFLAVFQRESVSNYSVFCALRKRPCPMASCN